MSWKISRKQELWEILEGLISSPSYPFDENLHQLLPDLPGLYAISDKQRNEGRYLRAGRTDQGRLRQRIYRNHLMGKQIGNLRHQPVDSGICKDLEDAKIWIKEHCQVQWMAVPDKPLIRWAEHFVLSILRPQYCD